MLKTIDAENFCSGHAGIKTRTDIENHLAEIAAFQQKIKKQVSEGKTLEHIQAVFSENEGRLVESVYNEIKEM